MSQPSVPPAPPKSAQSKSQIPKAVLIVVGAVLAIFSLMTFCCCGMVIMGQGITAQLKEDLAEGDKLWTAGNEEEAVAKYRSLLMHRSTLRGDMPRIYGRLIDHAYETGDTTEGRRLTDEAIGNEIDPSVTHAEALATVDTVRANKKAEEANRLAKREEEEAAEALKSAPVEEQLKAKSDFDFVEAVTLYRKFKSNEVSADATYTGKDIFVSGSVAKVEKASFGGVVIHLESDSFGYGAVDCYLSGNAKSSEDLAEIVQGSWIKVTGTCAGLNGMSHVQLDDCDFVLVNP